MNLAKQLAEQGHKVTLAEKENDFMQRASYVNQARVHNGYHYPRSILTGLRSRISFPRFCKDFSPCIDSSFEKYYMIPKQLSKVSPKQFELFCQRIGIPCEPAPQKIQNLANSQLIDKVYSTMEYAFDSSKLKNIMLEKLAETNTKLITNCEITSVQQSGKKLTAVATYNSPQKAQDNFSADHIFNCTYSMINNINKQSSLEHIPLKHELTEICLIDVPDPLKNIGITVMDGPFFSAMPFPSRGLHSLSHVRYTPHHEWHDSKSEGYINAHEHYSTSIKNSAYKKMLQDAQRYIPCLRECTHRDSIWEVKTILPRSENNDSRPILFDANHGIPNYHCIMGGKIDNIYDIHDALSTTGLIND